jgi:pimeloyl-ACP methyl ester carboxylesterase
MKKRRWVRGLVTALLAVLLLVLVGPFLVPVLPAAGTVPPQQLADPDSQFIQLNGLSVHVKTLGQGSTTFILLHGFGASLFSWREVMEPLSQYGKVIAYDRPAFGLTERPMEWSSLNPYGPEENIALLSALMDHYKVQQAILVGNSAGGTLAMQFALAYPAQVQALILVDPAVGSGGAPAWINILGKTPQMQHLGPLFVRSIRKSGLEMLREAWHDPSMITQAIMDGYTRPLKAENWDRALWDFSMASHDTGLTQHLQDFQMPILVITGDDDRLIPTAGTVKLAGEIPGARLVVIPQAGHVPHEEQPAAFMEAVDAFISTLKLNLTHLSVPEG